MPRRLFRHILAAAILCGASPAWALTNVMTPTETGISSLRLTATPKMTIRVTDFQVASVYVSLSRATATALLMSCTTGPTQTLQAPIAVAAVNPNTGLIQMSPASWSFPVLTSGTYRMQVAPLNDTYLVCTFSGTNASTDSVSVYTQLGG